MGFIIMSRYAIIENGKVKNVVVADESLAQANGWVNGTNANIGDEWDGATFTPTDPVIPVPDSVSTFQAKAALLDAGLLDDFQALIDDAGTSAVLKLAWTCAPVFLRNSPAIVSMTALAGLTSGEVDDLFIAASNISV